MKEVGLNTASVPNLWIGEYPNDFGSKSDIALEEIRLETHLLLIKLGMEFYKTRNHA